MNKPAKAVVTVLLMAAFAAAVMFSLRSRQQQQAEQQAAVEQAAVTELTGLIALDVEEFFKDPQVVKVLAANRLPAKVTRIGSRDMAARLAAGPAPDFLFASGVVAANQIADAARQARLNTAQVAPFHTPMVIASWEPIAKILVDNGIARPLHAKVYGVDMDKLTQTMLARKRWKDLKNAGAYEVSRSVLVSTTDVRRSNSAAMYLALTSSALHGDLVTDRETARKVAQRLAELLKRQGYQENYVNGNFDDYVSQGAGKTPMAWIYENQIVSYALARKGIGAEMVLMYPQPTITNKVVFVSTIERAKALGALLATNAELQGIAMAYGFRIPDAQRFAEAVKPSGLAIEPRLTQVVDPPSSDVMTEMIDVVAKEMTQ